MFHPDFTAPPGTGSYTATFEAFVVDTATGTPIAAGNTGPFALNWTVVPDRRPTVSIAQKTMPSWPTTATKYVLESANSLMRSVHQNVHQNG